jgi:peptide/nickel transport system substrate-binding protein
MMKRFFLFALIALMVIAPAFAGGGAEQPKDTPPAEKVAEEAPKTEVADVREPVAPGLTIPVHEGWEIGKKGGRFVMAQLGAGPKTFNFALAEETSSTDVTERLFTPLTRRNQMTLEWEGAAAESWTFSDDQKNHNREDSPRNEVVRRSPGYGKRLGRYGKQNSLRPGHSNLDP